jgi:glutathione S-transferase
LIVLYDNPFSPFTRKVRMVLRIKDVAFESIDALAVGERGRLAEVNLRAEVPVLADGGLVVANSADIVAYLEDRFPEPPLFPSSPELRAKARSWQRIADTVLDAIIHDISLWAWPTHRRTDSPPAGLIDAGRRDLEAIFARLERSFEGGDFVCGELSAADLALFPHISSLRVLGISLAAHPGILRWSRRMRTLPAVQADLEHIRQSVVEKFASGASPYEAEKVVWRGDRIEWLLAHGFHGWLVSELRSGRAVVPRQV